MSSTSSSRSRGRSRISVDRSQLELLRNMRFTWDQISAILGPSYKTLQRRAKEWDIRTYCELTDTEIDEAVRGILHNMPNAGEVMVAGSMVSLRIRVQRRRLRQSIHRVRGTEGSTSRHIYRRVYSVPGPIYLWHIDGNHKLIKYRLVIHGAIDGFSRLLTFLSCANNNTAHTDLSRFMEATQKYGVPSRVRTDYGVENIGVWRFMEAARGEGRSSYIAGSSVHNSRIERLWRDMYNNVTSTYLAVFSELANNNILDPLNDTDLFCLHYTFIPRINQTLKHFVDSWNNHALSTESNLSPTQLFTAFSYRNDLFENDSIDPQVYGTAEESDIDDTDGSADDSEENERGLIPETESPLTSESFDSLLSSIDPLSKSTSYGADLYIRVITKVHSIMS